MVLQAGQDQNVQAGKLGGAIRVVGDVKAIAVFLNRRALFPPERRPGDRCGKDTRDEGASGLIRALKARMTMALV